MTSPWFEPTISSHLTTTEVTVHRQPVVYPNRSVHGYAVSVVVRTPLAQAHRGAELDALVHAELDSLDLATLAGGSVVFLHATAGMLNGEWIPPDLVGGLVLEVPGYLADLPDTLDNFARLRANGVGLALADYVPGGSQDALLPLIDFVKVDLGRGDVVAAYAVSRAHADQVSVIAERVDSEAAVHFCTKHSIEMLQGPLFQRDTTPTTCDFTVGQTQCLELMALLIADGVDLDRVIRVVCSDPEFTMRVLELVNSSAFGMRSRIDSARRAVVMLGPRPLITLAMASLIGSRDHTTAELWFILTRAIACRAVAGDDDVAYTVGLLSAVASQLRIDPTNLIARTGVSDEVGDALLTLSGPYGPILGAVLAHEENDIEGVEETGLDPFIVAHAYLDAVAEAVATATALSKSRA